MAHPKDNPRGLPTGRDLAASGYRGFNTDIGPPVDNPTATTVGGDAPRPPAAPKTPAKPTATKPPAKPAKR